MTQPLVFTPDYLDVDTGLADPGRDRDARRSAGDHRTAAQIAVDDALHQVRERDLEDCAANTRWRDRRRGAKQGRFLATGGHGGEIVECQELHVAVAEGHIVRAE